MAVSRAILLQLTHQTSEFGKAGCALSDFWSVVLICLSIERFTPVTHCMKSGNCVSKKDQIGNPISVVCRRWLFHCEDFQPVDETNSTLTSSEIAVVTKVTPYLLVNCYWRHSPRSIADCYCYTAGSQWRRQWRPLLWVQSTTLHHSQDTSILSKLWLHHGKYNNMEGTYHLTDTFYTSRKERNWEFSHHSLLTASKQKMSYGS